MTAHRTRISKDGVSDQGNTTPTLDDLLQWCAFGDVEAFDQVYTATAAQVFGLVLRVVAQYALAEEITQDVFTYVWTEAGRFQPSRGSAASWILTIAHRRAVDRVRSVSASRTRDEVWERKMTPAPFDATAHAAHSSLEAARVRHALATLTLKQRAAVQLAYFDGLSYPEVAAHLGIPLGTAKTRIRDGLRALASVLEPGMTRA